MSLLLLPRKLYHFLSLVTIRVVLILIVVATSVYAPVSMIVKSTTTKPTTSMATGRAYSLPCHGGAWEGSVRSGKACQHSSLVSIVSLITTLYALCFVCFIRRVANAACVLLARLKYASLIFFFGLGPLTVSVDLATVPPKPQPLKGWPT